LEGKSQGMYKSLNCGLGSNDKKKEILINLKKVSKTIGATHKKVFLLNQVHSSKFCYIHKKLKFKKKKYKGDALITDQKNIPLGVLTADCAPVLIYDKNKNMIAAIHAGWKGAYKGIVKKVIKFMLKKGCKPNTMTAIIGPCISMKSYEIKKDFKDRFIKKDEKNKIFFKNIKGKTYFSLNKYIYCQLKNLNIKNIEIINKDTFDVKNNFFSARRSISHSESDYGRNISIIMIN
jgi:YfiH family protein